MPDIQGPVKIVGNLTVTGNIIVPESGNFHVGGQGKILKTSAIELCKTENVPACCVGAQEYDACNYAVEDGEQINCGFLTFTARKKNASIPQDFHQKDDIVGFFGSSVHAGIINEPPEPEFADTKVVAGMVVQASDDHNASNLETRLAFAYTPKGNTEPEVGAVLMEDSTFVVKNFRQVGEKIGFFTKDPVERMSLTITSQTNLEQKVDFLLDALAAYGLIELNRRA